MALFVLCDPGYRNNVWCDHKLRGIQDEANRRREKIRFFTDIVSFEAAASKYGADSSVILLFDAISYIQKVAPVLSRLQLHPIFSGVVSDIRLPFQFSCVSPDMNHCGRMIADYVYSSGKTRIAEVGINPNSWSDISRLEALGRYLREDEHRVFYAKEDLTESYRDFLEVHDQYDAVICTTDHIAISLIEFLKENDAYDPSQFFISYGDTMVARLYGEGLSSVTVSYYTCGKVAAETHFNRLKYGWSAVTILVESSLVIRGSTGNIQYVPSKTLPKPHDLHPPTEFFNFRLPNINVGRLERLLAVSDIDDLRLMYCMLCDYSYEDTAALCFMSAETAKYRIRKIRKMLQAESKADAVELLRRYIKKEMLFEVIKEMEHGNNMPQ